MKILFRLFKIILYLLASLTIVTCVPEYVYYTVRWVITGREFPMPFYGRLFNYIDNLKPTNNE